MRLRNRHTHVQITVPASKARRLIAEGIYLAVPDDEQPSEPEASQDNQVVEAGNLGRDRSNRRGPTSIAAALKDGAGPWWDTPTN